MLLFLKNNYCCCPPKLNSHILVTLYCVFNIFTSKVSFYYRFLMCAERGSFVVGLFLCTPIAIRAFRHVGKNVAFEGFWQNCVRGAQNETSQHRTCYCLARLTGSWRPPFIAGIGHVCSKTYYKVDTLPGRPLKTQYKCDTLFRYLVGYWPYCLHACYIHMSVYTGETGESKCQAG